MFGDLSGQSALVTGASRGLGLHFARTLARHGVAVTLAARPGPALSAARAVIERDGGRTQIVELDVRDSNSIAQAIDSIQGGIDIVVNNAGINAPGPAIETTEAEWSNLLDTNLKGVFLVAQAAAKRMAREGRGGTIVNVASILGLRVAGHVAAYAASKGGVVQLTKALALEWARYRIRVNALCPGYIETELNREFFASEAGQKLIGRIPQRRIGRPEDLNAALLLLCSGDGSYITGTTLAVDGGHLVSSL